MKKNFSWVSEWLDEFWIDLKERIRELKTGKTNNKTWKLGHIKWTDKK